MNKAHVNQVYTMRSVVDGSRHINQAQLRCTGCKHVEPIQMRPDMPPDQVLKKFRQRGWQVDIKHADRCFCPDCKSRKTANNNVPQPKGEPMNAIGKHQPASIITMPDLPTCRRILGAIEGHFDEESGRYLGDWSDKKIAAETGIAWGIVAKVREEFGLKIKGDPEVIALRTELNDLITKASDIETRLAKLEAR